MRSLNVTLMLCVLDMEMFSQLNNTVGVIDMDGFTINKKFYCKELGILRVGNAAAQSYFFSIWEYVGVICRKKIGRHVGT